jgi:omega-amidase
MRRSKKQRKSSVKSEHPMQDISITYLQSSLHWENPEENRRLFTSSIETIEGATDLVILPEMFNTGFSMRPEVTAEAMDGPTVNWMREMARQRNCVITGSLAIAEKGRFYNRLVWMRPDGTYSSYDKRHLFRHGHEPEHYQAGTKKLIVELKGWKICPLICYDLRFPVWSRNRWENKTGTHMAAYDLLLYVANWPEVRSLPWKTLLLARAIENQAYVAGVNRIGNAGEGISHSGDSAVIGFKGELLSQVNTGKDFKETILLSYNALVDFRRDFPVGMDADEFSLV